MIDLNGVDWKKYKPTEDVLIWEKIKDLKLI